jgi:LacI family transcriptional regulator
MSSINDIAKEAGVSIATVSRAFSDGSNINQSTRKIILEIAHRMDYSPKIYHKHTPSHINTEIIGVIISCRNYPWFNMIASGINTVMESKNITPIFTDTNEMPYKEIICIDKIKDFVGGMLVISSSGLDDYNTTYIEKINKTIPIVTLVRNINIYNIDSVAVDCFHHTSKALNRLIENGHHHIAIINGPMVIKPSMDRFAAYIEVLKSNDIPIRNEYIYYGDFDENHAYNIANELLDSNPRVTAIFSSNTIITRGCLKAINDRNLKIPDDIAFISYGDDYSFSLKNMNITAIEDPNYNIGKIAAELLLERMQDSRRLKKKPKRIIVSPDLIFRGSEAYPKNREKFRF